MIPAITFPIPSRFDLEEAYLLLLGHLPAICNCLDLSILPIVLPVTLDLTCFVSFNTFGGLANSPEGDAWVDWMHGEGRNLSRHHLSKEQLNMQANIAHSEESFPDTGCMSCSGSHELVVTNVNPEFKNDVKSGMVRKIWWVYRMIGSSIEADSLKKLARRYWLSVVKRRCKVFVRNCRHTLTDQEHQVIRLLIHEYRGRYELPDLATIEDLNRCAVEKRKQFEGYSLEEVCEYRKANATRERDLLGNLVQWGWMVLPLPNEVGEEPSPETIKNFVDSEPHLGRIYPMIEYVKCYNEMKFWRITLDQLDEASLLFTPRPVDIVIKVEETRPQAHKPESAESVALGEGSIHSETFRNSEPGRRTVIRLEDALTKLAARVKKENRKKSNRRHVSELCVAFLIEHEIHGKPGYSSEDLANRYSKYLEKLRITEKKVSK